MPTPRNMKCPECGERLLVTDSRAAYDQTILRRRRECSGCGTKVSTFEVIAPSAKHIVVLGEWEINANEMAKRHQGILG